VSTGIFCVHWNVFKKKVFLLICTHCAKFSESGTVGFGQDVVNYVQASDDILILVDRANRFGAKFPEIG
jgi:hypothetical protein